VKTRLQQVVINAQPPSFSVHIAIVAPSTMQSQTAPLHFDSTSWLVQVPVQSQVPASSPVHVPGVHISELQTAAAS
jgi:hypothetical protein